MFVFCALTNEHPAFMQVLVTIPICRVEEEGGNMGVSDENDTLLREGDVVVERGVVHSVKERHEGKEVHLVLLTRVHDGKRENR